MKIFSVILLASMVISCNKLNIEKDTPKCIKNKIEDFNKSSVCDDAIVKEYTFQGNTVYTFDPGTCGADLTTEVVSSSCNNLGYLGGLSGNTMINGEEFSNAMFIKITWQK